jgi:hypothetical protein
VAAAEELRRLADRVIDAVMQARYDHEDDKRRECPGCRSRPLPASCRSGRAAGVLTAEAAPTPRPKVRRRSQQQGA